MNIHQEIYKKLQTAAMSKKSVTYSSLASIAGLNMDMQEDRTKLGEILGSISTNEHQNNRPLLSVVAWFSGRAEPSKGFYNLAESLGVYSSKQDKDTFFINELNKTYDYWGDIENNPTFDVEISVNNYKKALQSEGVLKERSLDLLHALFDAPNCEATATELANLLGYEHYQPANILIGNLGVRIAKSLNIENPSNRHLS